MKKVICLLLLMCACFSLYAFDRALIGSWGIIMSNEKEEFIRFGQNDVRILNMLFTSRDFERAEDTIFIEDFDGDSVVIQYYLLAPNKLLFIMWNVDDPLESLTLILSKL